MKRSTARGLERLPTVLLMERHTRYLCFLDKHKRLGPWQRKWLWIIEQELNRRDLAANQKSS